MKHIKITFLVLSLVMLVLVGCNVKPNITNAQDAEPVMNLMMANSITPTVQPIWAGQNINAGTVSIQNDANYLYVTYNTTGGWMLQQTHVHVAYDLAGIPKNNQGIPVPGQFAYSTTHNPVVNNFTYNIPLANYNFQPGQEIVIAAHASLINGDYPDGVYQQETGWGGDNPGPGRRWWYYIRYTFPTDDPDDPGPGGFDTETAMIRMYDVPSDFTYRWGTHPWFSYVKMYADPVPQTFYFYAAQHYKVGEVEIWKDGNILYVELNLDAPYEIQQSHLNVQLMGYSGPPAFGLFPYTMAHDPRVTTYTYQVPWQNAWDGQELNISLHGEVGPF